MVLESLVIRASIDCQFDSQGVILQKIQEALTQVVDNFIAIEVNLQLCSVILCYYYVYWLYLIISVFLIRLLNELTARG